MRYRIYDKEEINMHGHHGRCREMHGMMNDDHETYHIKMRCHGMKHGHGMGHDPQMCGRHFPTNEEKMEMLERYKEWLEKEAKGLQEQIDKMKE